MVNWRINMKKLKIILIILIIINILFMGIIISNLQIFKSPKIDMEIEILDVNSNEIVLGTNIKIDNPNSMDLIVKDLNIVSKTNDGLKIGKISIDGGKIGANKNKDFKSIDNLSFQSNKIKSLKNTVKATIGVNILGFIQKTIPLEMTITMSLDEVFNSIKVPKIKINSHFNNLTTEGLEFTTDIDIHNPTNFEFDIKNLSLNMKTNKNLDVGKIKLNGDRINPESSQLFISNGTVKYEAFDSDTLYMEISGKAGAKIAGIEKQIDFSAEASFEIPSIKDFIFNNDTFDVGLPVQLRFGLTGLHTEVGLGIYNPSNVPILAKNIHSSMYRQDNNNITLLGEDTMEPCSIAPRDKVCVHSEIVVSYKNFFFSGVGKILPDWYFLRIDLDFTIEGTDQSIPLSVNAFVDPHFLRIREFTEPQIIKVE